MLSLFVIQIAATSQFEASQKQFLAIHTQLLAERIATMEATDSEYSRCISQFEMQSVTN
jgi:hypothetical protein